MGERRLKLSAELTEKGTIATNIKVEDVTGEAILDAIGCLAAAVTNFLAREGNCPKKVAIREVLNAYEVYLNEGEDDSNDCLDK